MRPAIRDSRPLAHESRRPAWRGCPRRRLILRDDTLGLLLKGYAWAPGVRERQAADGPPTTRLLGRPVLARVCAEFRRTFDGLRGREVTLFDEGALVLARAVADWVGVPGYGAAAAERLARDCVSMVDGFATPGPRHLRARQARARQEALLRGAVVGARARGTPIGAGARDRQAGPTEAGSGTQAESGGSLAERTATGAGAGTPARADMDTAAAANTATAPAPAPTATTAPAPGARSRKSEGPGGPGTGGTEEQPRPAADQPTPAGAPAPAGPPRTPFEAVMAHRGVDGAPLDAGTAAVELLNILRPTVAITWFATFAAHAMRDAPELRRRLAADDPAGLAASFAHEVRRFYPFVPFVGALAPDGLVVGGRSVPGGTMLLLDVFGQNHDPGLWDEPFRFVPGRFLGAPPGRDALIPQGGGPPEGHRCPGEDITIAVLTALARELARLDFTVPAQDLRVSLRRIPARPRDGFRLGVPR